MGTMRSGYFFDVKVTGNRVRVSYNLKCMVISGATGTLANSIERATGWRFDNDHYRNQSAENFNIDKLSEFRTRDYDWYIDNATTRNNFVLALRALGQALAASGYIDPINLDTGKVLRQITRKNEVNPLMNIGGKTYRIQLVEEKVSPFRVEEEFQQEIQVALDAMEAGYNERLAEAEEEYKASLAEIQSQRTMVFNLTRQDHLDGYSTYQLDGRGWLVLRFRWKPINFVYRYQSYKIKDDVAEDLACDAEIHVSQGGSIRVFKPGTLVGISHPHVYDHGSMCTGSYTSRASIDASDAKVIVQEIKELMSAINADSLVKGKIGNFDFYAGQKFVEECCEPLESKVAEGAII